jgi:hypothetical protein
MLNFIFITRSHSRSFPRPEISIRSQRFGLTNGTVLTATSLILMIGNYTQ